MNVLEGSRRMQLAGRWLIFAPLTVFVIVFGIGEAVTLFRGDPRMPLALMPFSLPLLVPEVALWVAGWIVEGFAKEPR